MTEIKTAKLKCKNKVIIFSQFAQMCKLLNQELKEYNPLMVIGDVSSPDRMDIVNKFNYDPKYKILIMSESGTYGLNLQAASYVINFDSPWSIGKRDQREDRAHRYGQTEPVTVYSLIAKGTIDEYVAKTLYKKQKLSVACLKDYERLEKTGMTEEDINNILRM